MMKIKGFNFKYHNVFYQKVFFLVTIFFALFLCFHSEDVKADDANQDFSYTGNYQEYVVPKDGIYKIQLWGAQGGNYDSTLFGGSAIPEKFLRKI